MNPKLEIIGEIKSGNCTCGHPQSAHKRVEQWLCDKCSCDSFATTESTECPNCVPVDEFVIKLCNACLIFKLTFQNAELQSENSTLKAEVERLKKGALIWQNTFESQEAENERLRELPREILKDLREDFNDSFWLIESAFKKHGITLD